MDQTHAQFSFLAIPFLYYIAAYSLAQMRRVRNQPAG